MSALFVRTDLERCARLTARELHEHPGSDPELAIARAVGTVASQGFTYYDDFCVKDMLRYVLGRSDVDQVFHEALQHVQKV